MPRIVYIYITIYKGSLHSMDDHTLYAMRPKSTCLTFNMAQKWMTLPNLMLPCVLTFWRNFDSSPYSPISLCSWWEGRLPDLVAGKICRTPEPLGLKTRNFRGENFPSKIFIHEVETIIDDHPKNPGAFWFFQRIDRYNIAYALDNKVCQLLSLLRWLWESRSSQKRLTDFLHGVWAVFCWFYMIFCEIVFILMMSLDVIGCLWYFHVFSVWDSHEVASNVPWISPTY